MDDLVIAHFTFREEIFDDQLRLRLAVAVFFRSNCQFNLRVEMLRKFLVIAHFDCGTYGLIGRLRQANVCCQEQREEE